MVNAGVWSTCVVCGHVGIQIHCMWIDVMHVDKNKCKEEEKEKTHLVGCEHVDTNWTWMTVKKKKKKRKEHLLVADSGHCHDCDIPPQPSHIHSCLLAVQTTPKQSLTKPKPIPGLPDPSIAFPNPSAAFQRRCCIDVCLVSIPEAVNTIPKHI